MLSPHANATRRRSQVTHTVPTHPGMCPDRTMTNGVSP